MKCNLAENVWRRLFVPTLGIAIALSSQCASAQVSPAEILNPDLKALEETYFPQLKALNQSIAKTKFPFPFYLDRKSTRLNSSHTVISYAVFCLKKKKNF